MELFIIVLAHDGDVVGCETTREAAVARGLDFDDGFRVLRIEITSVHKQAPAENFKPE